MIWLTKKFCKRRWQVFGDYIHFFYQKDRNIPFLNVVEFNKQNLNNMKVEFYGKYSLTFSFKFS